MGFINYELYRIFYVVAKSGSITKAAGELFISQPAVSQSIKQLESQMGGRLFVRTSKGMELTYEGRAIYDYIKQANILINIAEKKFSQLKELTFGEIRIGASDTITKHFLLKYIKKFLTQYPSVSVKITNRTSGETIRLLKEGKVDIGFVNTPISDDYVDVKNCSEVKEIFVSGTMRPSKPLNEQEIANLPLIMLEKLSNSRKAADAYFESAGVTLSPVMELGSLDLVADMAKSGLGVALVPADIVEKELADGTLYSMPLTFEMPPRNIALVSLKNVPLNFSAQQFAAMTVK